jgi:Rps23 Pro-64 3,4-dihydroxylase Tpa1-like proline 4-hydroxylase
MMSASSSASKAQRVLFELNSVYDADEFKSTFSETLRERKTWNNGSSGASFHVTPFPCCVLDEFLSDNMLLTQLEVELKDQMFHQKSNDLYKFQQSDDLRECDGACITGLRDFLVSYMKDWMQDITGIHLTGQVDATCSIYNSTDTLLCHDDELEGRRIAFILYLVRDWMVSDGGTLDLFSVDEHGQPDVIARSLLPTWNSFVFFEVSPVSFHQVAEVLNSEKTRLSVSGWFYGEPFDYPERYCEPPLQCSKPNRAKVDLLFECINPRYFDPEIQAEIRGQFEEESSIELQQFLLVQIQSHATFSMCVAKHSLG